MSCDHLIRGCNRGVAIGDHCSMCEFDAFVAKASREDLIVALATVEQDLANERYMRQQEQSCPICKHTGGPHYGVGGEL